MIADDAKMSSAIEKIIDHNELQEDLLDSCEWAKDGLSQITISRNANAFNMEMLPTNMNTN